MCRGARIQNEEMISERVSNLYLYLQNNERYEVQNGNPIHLPEKIRESARVVTLRINSSEFWG